MSFVENLKDRKIVQWGLAYLATAWLVMQLVDVVGPRWGVSAGTSRVVDILLIIGFFVALVFAWYHGERGQQHVSGPELLIIAGLLGVGAIGLYMLDLPQPATGTVVQAPPDIDQPAENGSASWLAVLPFRVQGGDQELLGFAEGITDDVTAGLSRFSHLRVLSRTATEDLGNGDTGMRGIQAQSGARYLMEGSVRRAGSTIRLTAQFVDSGTGTTIWSETFDRNIRDGEILAIQDEITNRIVATVGDSFGVVARTLAASIEGRDPETLSPYEAVLRWFLYQERINEADHLETRTALESAVDADPSYADAWAALGNIYLQEYMHDYNQRPNALDRALTAAKRGVTQNPVSALAHYSLAQVHFFRQDLDAFRVTAERAIDLNPLDTNAVAMLGILTGYGGDWDRSNELTTRAMELNPNHPGWYRFSTFFNEYRQGNYEAALDIALRINMPTYFADPMVRAITYAELGDIDAAKAAAEQILAIWPDFEKEYVEQGLINWIYAQPELSDQVYDSLDKAGLDMQR